jgi:phage baseplate assembly protein gpV
MVRFGLVCELGKGEYAGYARVYFDDVDIISDWLALPSCATLEAKCWIPIEINSQVACVIDDDTEQGFIANVLWSRPDAPPEWANDKRMGIMFADGAKFYYDFDKQELTVDAPESELKIKCKSLSIEGDVDIKGNTHIAGETLNIEVEEKVGIKGKTLEIEGEEKVGIKGDTEINGKTSVTGNIETTEEVISGIIKLKGHVHSVLDAPSGPSMMLTP